MIDRASKRQVVAAQRGYIAPSARQTTSKHMANANGPAGDLNPGTKSMKVLLTRNLTIVEDKNATRSVYTGVATVDQIVDIDTSENVRGYIAATGSATKVHRAIRDSLERNPADFHVLNGGLTIVAEGSTWDETTRQLILVNPSLINGGQTQGVIKDFLKDRAKRFEAEPDQEMSTLPSVHFQLIVTEDKTLVADISIARNSQNSVKAISIVGGKGQLDELADAIKPTGLTLQISEDQNIKAGNYLPTEKLIQVIMALVPDEIKVPGRSSKDSNKAYCYSQKSACLLNFSSAQAKKDDDDQSKELYQFCLDIAVSAWGLYSKWQKHQGFSGSRLHAIERNKAGEIVEVPDGILFPILAAHACFIKRDSKGKWVMTVPEKADKDLIDAAKAVYQSMANSDPNKMGKSKDCYSLLEVMCRNKNS